jgi:hypothetical protein
MFSDIDACTWLLRYNSVSKEMWTTGGLGHSTKFEQFLGKVVI